MNLTPGDSLHYRFVARVPGAFMYHCGTAPAAMHIANGMYGAFVVDPATPLPRAREFVFVQSEFYLTPKSAADGTRSLEWEKLLSLAPDHVVFNGRAGQYASHPIEVRPNELLRLYVVNAGPNRISSFHVVGAIFERVYEGGFQATPVPLPLRHSRIRRRDQGRCRRPAGARAGREGERAAGCDGALRPATAGPVRTTIGSYRAAHSSGCSKPRRIARIQEPLRVTEDRQHAPIVVRRHLLP